MQQQLDVFVASLTSFWTQLAGFVPQMLAALLLLFVGWLLVQHLGVNYAMRDCRKHAGWYMSGYPVGPEVRRRFSMVKTLMELEDIVAELDPGAQIVEGGERIKRGHTNGPIRVSLPDGWLDGHRREELLHDVSVPDDDQVMALSGG